MTKRALVLLLCLSLWASATPAQNSPRSTSPANQEETEPTCADLSRACIIAARELKAARALIRAYEEQIAAMDIRLKAVEEQLAIERRRGEIERERADALQQAIETMNKAVGALNELREEQAKQIAKLEKKLSRARTVAVVSSVLAALVAIFGRR